MSVKTKTLEERVELLERILFALNPAIKQLAEQAVAPQVDEKTVAYERYKAGAEASRKIQLDNEVIAIFAHYHYKKNVSPKAIGNTSLMSMGKAYGLAEWDLQFMHDYLVVHDLQEIYDHASEMEDLIAKYPDMAKLNETL